MILPVLLSLVVGTAAAEEGDGPYMWGAGPTLSTVVFPGRYPVRFANEAEEAGTLESLRGDIGIGARGLLYMDGSNRFGLRGTFGIGAGGYKSAAGTAEYDRILVNSNNIGVFAGGGLGFGAQGFKGETEAALGMTTYVLRAQSGVHFRDKARCYELALFGLWNIPGEQTYTDPDGVSEDASGGFYGHVGIEGSLYFGDFKPPKIRD